ncbi:MAG: cytochrome c peroxidase [Bacteroidia bacterium]
MKVNLFILSIILIASFSLRESDKSLFNIPKGWPKPEYNFKINPPSENKILLGRALFYDPILSRDGSISCASCHSQYSAFTHVDHDLSHGIDDRIGKRNSPILVNLAWQKSFMWDGAVNHLDVQALAPIHNELEMDEDIANVVKKLNQSKFYRSLFYDAFSDSIVSGEHTLKAISQFMLTLISANSKYDRVMNNEEEFSLQEAKGYKVFKESCSSCHTEPLFTNKDFKSNGLSIDSSLMDYGRVEVTSLKKDSFLFKVPSLRNIEFSYPYMHDGRFKTLNEVLNHYNNSISSTQKFSDELSDYKTLSSNEKVELIAFLLTLTDKEFLFNPDFSYPKELFTKANSQQYNLSNN